MGCVEVVGRYRGKTYVRKTDQELKREGLAIVFELEDVGKGKKVDMYLIPEYTLLKDSVEKGLRKDLRIFDKKVRLKGYHFIEDGRYVEWIDEWIHEGDILDICDDSGMVEDWKEFCLEKAEDWSYIVDKDRGSRFRFLS